MHQSAATMAALTAPAGKATITLTTDQKAALKRVLAAVKNKQSAALHGPAGTGKTTLTRQLHQELLKQDHRPVFASPTHKAAGVLRDVLPPGVTIKTVASVLRLKPAMRGKRIIFLPDRYNTDGLDPNCTVLIVDESSMISAFMGNQLEQLCRSRNIPLVMVGDAAQLPPVDSKKDAEVDEDREEDDPDDALHSQPAPQFLTPDGGVSRLSRVVRHQGPVLQFATALRQAADLEAINRLWPSAPQWDQDSAISLYATQRDWLAAAAKVICRPEWDDQPDCARVVVWSNRQCHSIGAALRVQRYGRQAIAWQPGEILANGDAIPQPGRSMAQPLAPAAMEWRVLSAELTTLRLHAATFPWETPARKLNRMLHITAAADVARLKLEPLHGGDRGPITVMTELPGQRVWGDQIQQLAADIKAANLTREQSKDAWKAWHFLRSHLADLRPASVLTVHRSQGSTFAEVFVGNDLGWCDSKEAPALHYVAATRASRHLHLLRREH